jgi:hypothetical protein
MTQDEIIEMAEQAGFEIDCCSLDWHKRITAFANLVAAKATEEANARANASWELMCKKMVEFEREACAKVAERFEPDEKTSYVTYASTAIRARSNT